MYSPNYVLLWGDFSLFFVSLLSACVQKQHISENKSVPPIVWAEQKAVGIFFMSGCEFPENFWLTR